jgi:hypothetical protein
MKSTRAPAVVLAATVGLAGLGIGAIAGPVAASAATSGGTTVSERLTAIKDALAGLVKDGTLTQAQADKVATTLDGTLPQREFGGRFGRHGMRMGAGLDEVASVIGISQDELRTQLQSGKTLVEIAKAKGISQSTLVSKLVSAAKSRLADAVKAGRITQAQADQFAKDLQSRITDMVTRTGPMGGRMHHGFGGGDGPDGGTSPAAPTTPTTSRSCSA